MNTLTIDPSSGAHPALARWDLAGIGASLLCILHCVATPVMAVALPAAELLERPAHTAFAVGILCIGLLAFIPGYRRHRRWPVVLLALLGFGLLSAGVVLPPGTLGEGAEKALTLLGGALLITAHLRNGYLCKVCRVCGGAPCGTAIAEAPAR
ncbi:MAG: MerC family mercury resistance protein [Gammaproteobacteria bacterium]|jgi:peptidoglycan/LPS O-acetylase OafA/YrhL|nr:MerC family mercury resistance protein [Gammaproteobacteria bacterium]